MEEQSNLNLFPVGTLLRLYKHSINLQALAKISTWVLQSFPYLRWGAPSSITSTLEIHVAIYRGKTLNEYTVIRSIRMMNAQKINSCACTTNRWKKAMKADSKMHFLWKHVSNDAIHLQTQSRRLSLVNEQYERQMPRLNLCLMYVTAEAEQKSMMQLKLDRWLVH